MILYLFVNYETSEMYEISMMTNIIPEMSFIRKGFPIASQQLPCLKMTGYMMRKSLGLYDDFRPRPVLKDRPRRDMCWLPEANKAECLPLFFTFSVQSEAPPFIQPF